MNLLEIQRLCKRYRTGPNTVEVLRGISLEIAEGATTALVGASGAGKSTLLHILGALDRPSEGTVLFRGSDLFKRSDRELADFRSRSIGFVFQFHHLLPEFSALENVMMPALIARRNRKEAEQKLPNCWKNLVWVSVLPIVPASCPAESSSGWPLPVLW